MSNTTINFENTFAAINSAISEVNKRKEYLEAKNDELIVLKKWYDEAIESLDDIARDYQSESNIVEKLTTAKNIMGDLWYPENEEKLRESIQRSEEFKKEESEYLQKLKALTKSVEDIQAEFTKKEQIADNKVEAPKLEVKKDTALEDKSAKIKFADGGKYRVILSNGRELDCSISDKMNKYLDGIDTQKFYGTFSIKYDKNRFKDAKQEWFLCSVTSNN